MQLVNATPHEVTLIRKDGTTMVLSPSSVCPRVCTEGAETRCGEYDGVELRRVGVGYIVGLPDENDGICYLVASMVAQHPDVAHRNDLLSPTEFVRDDEGRIVAAKALVQYT